MLIQLSDKEASILLGATLMHWGAPFRTTPRRELTEEQQAMVDAASEKLISLRETYRHPGVLDRKEVLLSNQEAALLIAVVEDCLQECGSDTTELRLQLNANQREEVETLLERMRASLDSQYAKLA